MSKDLWPQCSDCKSANLITLRFYVIISALDLSFSHSDWLSGQNIDLSEPKGTSSSWSITDLTSFWLSYENLMSFFFSFFFSTYLILTLLHLAGAFPLISLFLYQWKFHWILRHNWIDYITAKWATLVLFFLRTWSFPLCLPTFVEQCYSSNFTFCRERLPKPHIQTSTIHQVTESCWAQPLTC